MQRLILEGDQVVASIDEPPLKDGAVVLEGERVLAIGHASLMRAQYPDARVLGGRDHVVMPGLIDAHQHGRGVTSVQRGVPDASLEQWLIRLRGLWPMDPYLAASLAALRLLRSGVTTTLHHFAFTGVKSFREELEACLEAYRDAGIRVTFTLDFRDRNYYVYASDEDFLACLPNALARTVREQLPPRAPPKPAEVIGLIPELERTWGSSRVQFALGPQGGEWSSDEALEEVAAYARDSGLPIHTHMLESRLQRHASLQEHGMSATARFARLGLLGPRTSLAHMVWATEEDLELVKNAGSVIVHNPASNLRLRSGIAPVLRMLRMGIAVAVGMDGMSLSDQGDYFQDLRLCRSLHFDDQGALDGLDVWRMVYEGGNKATCWGDVIGRLKPGCWGDALVLRLSKKRTVAPLDPAWEVMDRVLRESGPGSIRSVVVGGRVLLNDGEFTTLDEAAILNRVRTLAASTDRSALTARRSLVGQLEAAVDEYYRGRNVGKDTAALNALGAA